MALRWQLDDRDFPLVRMRVVGEDDGQLPDLESAMSAAMALFAQGKPCVLVHDLRHAHPDAVRRKKIKEWIASVPVEKRRLIKAYALVVHSAVQRGIVTALLWFFAHPLVPIQVFGDEASAVAWAREFLPPSA